MVILELATVVLVFVAAAKVNYFKFSLLVATLEAGGWPALKILSWGILPPDEDRYIDYHSLQLQEN